MSMDAKSPSPASSLVKNREKGIRIFMWPKVIYLYPSAIVSLICAIGMLSLQNKMYDPSKAAAGAVSTANPDGTVATDPAKAQVPMTKLDRFSTPQNLLGVLFLMTFAFNLIVMALDFPRFELVGIVLAVLFSIFFLLWIGSYFDLDLMRPIRGLFASVYTFANAGFYLAYFITLMIVFGIVYLTRWLDYWEVLPNEILHHHGPLSDLERFPTMNLKFDKEIPDTLEYFLLGAGRLVLHVPNVERSLVMDNVLFINSKEEALKKLMSRLEVRITTDQEVGERDT